MKQKRISKKRASPLDPEGKPLRVRFRLGLVTGFLLLVSGLCFGLLNLWFGTGRYGEELFDFYFQQPYLVLLNELPFVLLILLLWALTNRAWIAFLGTGVFTLIYSWAEYWKLLARSDPIVAEDLTVISEGMQMGRNYIAVTWQIVLSAVLVLLGTLAFHRFLRGRLPKLLPRLGIAALLVCVSVLLYNGVYLDNELYDSYPCWKKLNAWISSSQFVSRGCVYPFLNSVQRAVFEPPKGYTEEAAVAALEQYETDPIPEERKVNVIVVMAEAFADLSQYTDGITGTDPYAAYHALREQSLHGTLVTNIFAGGTIDTERAVLTGFPFLSNFRRSSWSFARYFADQGYAVNGSHPGYEAFYNRLSVNANLGIERYYFFENHYQELSGGIAPDRDLFPEILRLCREDLKETDYVFSYNVTYQNHGPYPTAEERFTDVYVPRGELDAESYTIVNNYLCGVEDTGNQLKALAGELAGDDEPWVLIFFGDHKPWLGDQDSAYTALGIDLISNSIESYYNYYNTEYLIWANGAAREKLGADFTGEGPMISPCYLMNVLFDECGWAGPSYLKFSRQTQSLLPVMCSNGSYILDNAIVWTANLTEEAKTASRLMHYVTYYLMRDSGGKLPAAQ